jgi:peptide/nickel transport system substrate-binding protein
MKRLAGVLLVILIVVAGLWTLRGPSQGGESRGNVELVATLRSQPTGFSRLLARDRPSLIVSQLINEPLVRINHVTQALEPALAEGWSELDAGRRFRLTLRGDGRFADGRPVTAEDVVFSVEAVYAPQLNSPLADGLRVGGKPIGVRTVDARTIDVTFPTAYGPGLRPLHSVPILARARYESAVQSGGLAALWSADAAPSGMIGAGPFMVERVEPGVAVHLVRNPHYWRVGDDGARLPRADRLRLDVVPSQDAEMLRLRSGDADVVTAELRPDDLPEARALAAQQRLQLFDLGPSLDVDMLWFNLTPRPEDDRRGWLQRRELREAISHAVDRTAFINAVYRGAAVQVASVISPGNHVWHASNIAPRPYSLAMAGELLDRIGVRDRNGDGVREDVYDQPATFTLLVQQGHTIRQRAAAVLQETLRPLGLQVEIASLDARGLQQRLRDGSYEAMYHALPGTDTDPSGLMEFWLSSGSLHLWHPGQASAATKWEHELDLLMTRQLSSTSLEERRALVANAQRILDEELPVVVFAAPRVTIATSGRLINVRPGLLAPQVLWNAAEIGVR